MTTYDPQNIFAKILRGEIPAQKIHETEHALAFYDAFPKAPLHALVIPKGKYVNLVDFCTHATKAEVLDFWNVVARVATTLNLTEKGFRMISNIGNDGRQEVPHFHVHLCGGRDLGPVLGG